MEFAGEDAHVLVAAAGDVDEQDVARGEARREAEAFGDGVGAFERGDDALSAREAQGGVESFGVGGGGIFARAGVVERACSGRWRR